jgi:hypothetical protein
MKVKCYRLAEYKIIESDNSKRKSILCCARFTLVVVIGYAK